MTMFLTSEDLSIAVERLSKSSSKRVCEFLIGKRTLNLSSLESVGLAESVPEYIQAVNELTQCAAGVVGDDWNGSPFFNPFGAARDHRGQGYRSKKFPSNGPSNTIHGWTQPDSPFEIDPSVSPKRISRKEGQSRESLRRYLLVDTKTSDDVPELIDAVHWWFRSTDLASRFGQEPATKELIEAFISDLSLTDDEAAAIFRPFVSEDVGQVVKQFATSIADPIDYLPGSTPSGGVQDGSSGWLSERVSAVHKFILSRGYVYEPWQIAAFVTAVRTKPFLILAGISGTGKTKLPSLIAESTGAKSILVPVRPDWTDSSDLIGYERIDGHFVPGALLRACNEAMQDPDTQYFFILDEMNIARVEYYLAEVLSLIEERKRRPDGKIVSPPLAPYSQDEQWNTVFLPENLCIVGTVNMDETTHGFSRKVLDRSFVLELSDIDLWQIPEVVPGLSANKWEQDIWRQPYLALPDLRDRSDAAVFEAIDALTELNGHLSLAQAQVGFRVRDEIALFCINAKSCQDLFTTQNEQVVSPLDLAINMKILPRLQGGGSATHLVLSGISSWAQGQPRTLGVSEEKSVSSVAKFPLTRARLDIMLQRLQQTGFTSYWL